MFNIGDYVVSNLYFLAVVKDIIKNKYQIEYLDDKYTVVTNELKLATETDFVNQIKLLDDCLEKSRADLDYFINNPPLETPKFPLGTKQEMVDATRVAINRLVKFRYNTSVAFEKFLNG